MMICVKFYLLSLILDVSYCNMFCTSTDSCPPDTPFCTNNGCVFECPKSSYLNGTYCVVDCGDWFVNNRTCVDHCPSETFTRESPKLIGRGIYIEKLCVTSCSFQEYIFNTSCVRACSVTHLYISGRRCVDKCPDDAVFMTNVTVHEMVLHKCENKCPHLVESGYCTNHCSDNLTIFNNTCVTTCPTTYKFISERTCVRQCPGSTVYIENITCSSKCPVKKPYLYNGKCVNECPLGFYRAMESDTWYCVENCSNDLFVYNQTCVTTCPNGTVINNKTCDFNCSNELPFLCEVHDSPHSICGTTDDNFYTIYPQRKYTICVKECPDNMYVLNSSCVASCPDGYTYLKGRCVHNCSDYFPFMYNRTDVTSHMSLCFGCKQLIIKPTCVEGCPLYMYSYNQMCYHACPMGLYTFAGKCDINCPTSMPFTKNETVTYEAYENMSYAWRKVKRKSGIVKCVENCGPEYVRFNGTCVKECPENAKYVTNRTCHETECGTKYMYNKSRHFECSDICEDDHFIYNKQCMETCPEHTLAYNRKCVSVCPDRSPFIFNKRVESSCHAGVCASVSKRVCVAACAKDMFVLNRTCVKECPEKIKYVTNRTCHETECDTKYMYNKSRHFECSDICENDYFIYNKQCFETCPERTIAFNRTCVYVCPDSSPFILNQRVETSCHASACASVMKTFCVETCAKDMFVLNRTCVLSCPKPLYIYNKTCVSDCPDKNSPAFYRELVLNPSSHGVECLSGCPQGRLIFNQTCYDECPKGAYSLNNHRCVHTCPDEKPLKFTGTTSYDTWKCIRNCKDDYVFENGDCKYRCSNQSIAFEGKCIAKCPQEYFWFNYDCYNLMRDVVTYVLIYVGIDIVLLLIGRQILRDYFTVMRMSLPCLINGRSSVAENRKYSNERRNIQNNCDVTVAENDIEMEEDQRNIISFEDNEAESVV